MHGNGFTCFSFYFKNKFVNYCLQLYDSGQHFEVNDIMIGNLFLLLALINEQWNGIVPIKFKGFTRHLDAIIYFVKKELSNCHYSLCATTALLSNHIYT